MVMEFVITVNTICWQMISFIDTSNVCISMNNAPQNVNICQHSARNYK